VEVVEGSLTDDRAVTKAVHGVDVVYHLAWQSNRATKLEGPRSRNEELISANVDGTERLLRACVKRRLRRFIYTSTVAVYGDSSVAERWPIGEEDVVAAEYDVGGFFERDYIVPKILVEDMVSDYAGRHDLPLVILRPSIVYGAGAQFAELWVWRVLRRIGLPGGFEPAQLLNVRDMVEALLLAEAQLGATNEVFNVAGNEMATVAQLEVMIRTAAFRFRRGLPRGHSPHFATPTPRARRVLRYDLTKAATVLNFVPKVSLQEGLAEMVEVVLREQASGRQGAYTTLRQPSKSGRTGGPGRVRRGRRGHTAAVGDLLNEYYGRLLSHDALGEYYGYSDFWNFGFWTEDTPSQEEACLNLMEKLLNFISKKEGTILDVACGKGATTRYLLRCYPPEKVTGINISEKQLEVCRKNAPDCNFLQMNAAELTFPKGSFDNIICVEAACHFETREDFLRGAYRVLKPGGRLVFSDVVLTPSSHGQPAANYLHSPAEYKQVCRRVGFDRVEVRDVTKECWERFSENLVDYGCQKLKRREISWRGFNRILHWLGTLSTELYVIGWCEKTGT
jgi:MPBQ/MSBQ methyltransferase